MVGFYLLAKSTTAYAGFLQDENVRDNDEYAASNKRCNSVDADSGDWIVPVIDRAALKDDGAQTDTDTSNVDSKEAHDESSKDDT